VGLASASRVAVWTFAAVAVSQLGFIVTSKVMTRANDLLTERHEIGAGISAYGYAFLFMLPHSLFTVSLVTALFTRLSQSAHRGDDAEVVSDLGRGLRMPAVLLVPATVAVVVLGPQVARAAFPGNSHAETLAIAGVMVAMMTGLVPFGWLYLVQRVFYAYEDAKTPFRLQVLVTIVASAVNLTALVAAPARAGVIVGIGQTVSNLLAALVGFVLLRRRLGPLRLAPTVRVYVRLAVASLAAAVPTLVLLWVLGRLGVDAERWSGAAVELALGGAVFVATALAVAHALRVDEVGQLLDPLTRRLRRRPA
jgi:putative peptidoglycan lipid II flippase